MGSSTNDCSSKTGGRLAARPGKRRDLPSPDRIIADRGVPIDREYRRSDLGYAIRSDNAHILTKTRFIVVSLAKLNYLLSLDLAR